MYSRFERFLKLKLYSREIIIYAFRISRVKMQDKPNLWDYWDHSKCRSVIFGMCWLVLTFRPALTKRWWRCLLRCRCPRWSARFRVRKDCSFPICTNFWQTFLLLGSRRPFPRPKISSMRWSFRSWVRRRSTYSLWWWLKTDYCRERWNIGPGMACPFSIA